MANRGLFAMREKKRGFKIVISLGEKGKSLPLIETEESFCISTDTRVDVYG